MTLALAVKKKQRQTLTREQHNASSWISSFLKQEKEPRERGCVKRLNTKGRIAKSVATNFFNEFDFENRYILVTDS